MASFFAALGFVRPASADLVEAGCKACLEQKGEAGAPLVVALHGDNAPAYHRKFAAALAGSALRAKVTLFAPRCPVELGCKTGSWWQWLATTDHDEGWLGARIDEAIARTGADPKRVVAVGYSGGATYLGYYGPSHPERFEAIAHVSGGAPLGARCPSLKYPVLFYLGAGDPMIAPYTEPLRKFYDGCGGHEVVWKTERGVTHEGMLDRLKAGGADEVIGWLLARARSRHPDPQPSPSPSLSLSLSPSPSPSPNPSPQPSPNPNPIPSPSSVPPPRPSRVAPRAGCGCELAGSATGDGGGVLVVLAIAAGLSRLGGRATSSLRLSRTRRVRR